MKEVGWDKSLNQFSLHRQKCSKTFIYNLGLQIWVVKKGMWIWKEENEESGLEKSLNQLSYHRQKCSKNKSIT